MFDSITAFDPNAGVLFPGSVIEAASLESGVLTAIRERRGHGSLNVTGLTFPNGTASATIQNPTSASTTASLVRILKQAPSETPAHITYEKASSASLDESLVSVGLSANWLGGSTSAALKAQSARAQSTMLLRFNQAYYTIDWQYDDLPFDRSVTVSQLKASNARLGLKNPPVYISSITYGRGLLIAITLDSTVEQLQSAVNVALGSPIFGGNGDLDTNTRKIIQSSEIKIVGIGGRSGNVTELISSDKPMALQNLL